MIWAFAGRVTTTFPGRGLLLTVSSLEKFVCVYVSWSFLIFAMDLPFVILTSFLILWMIELECRTRHDVWGHLRFSSRTFTWKTEIATYATTTSVLQNIWTMTWLWRFWSWLVVAGRESAGRQFLERAMSAAGRRTRSLESYESRSPHFADWLSLFSFLNSLNNGQCASSSHIALPEAYLAYNLYILRHIQVEIPGYCVFTLFSYR